MVWRSYISSVICNHFSIIIIPNRVCELSWNEIGISGLKTRKEDVPCIAGKKKLSDDM